MNEIFILLQALQSKTDNALENIVLYFIEKTYQIYSNCKFIRSKNA